MSPTVPLNICGPVSHDKYCWRVCWLLSLSWTGMEGNSHSPANSPVSWNRDTAQHCVEWNGVTCIWSLSNQISTLSSVLVPFHHSHSKLEQENEEWTLAPDNCGPEGTYMFLSTCLVSLLLGIVSYPKTAEERMRQHGHNWGSVSYLDVHG